jgi:hypothetical protein
VDIEIQAKEITRYRKLLEELIAQHTGQPLEKVAKDTDRDFILDGRRGRGVRSGGRGHQHPEDAPRTCSGGRRKLVDETYSSAPGGMAQLPGFI